MFISIDGGDGCGKSTQIERLEARLTEQGAQTLVCRDPGSTPAGEAIRDLLLDRRDLTIAPRSEMFLFMAARAQMMTEIVRPALAEGKIVIADRFVLSTLVYQGYAGGLSTEEIFSVAEIAVDRLFPDLTILLDIDPEIAFARLHRPLDRMEAKGREYHRRVRDGFLRGAHEMAARFGCRVVTLDGSAPPEAIAERISALLTLPYSRSE